MKFRASIILFFALSFVFLASAQEKKRLSHDDYAIWNTISGQQLSPDGQWLVYEVNPQDGDGTLVIYHFGSGEEVRVPRGYRASVSPANGYVAFYIKPQQAVVRQAKVDKKKKEEMPSDSLGIFRFSDRSLEKFAGPVTFALPEEPSDWMVYHIDNTAGENNRRRSTEPEPEDQDPPADSLEVKEPPKTKNLFVFNPLDGTLHQINDIGEYLISPQGNLVAGVAEINQGDTLKQKKVVVFETQSQLENVIDEREGEIRELNVDFAGSQLAWLHSTDTGDAKVYGLWLWEQRRNRLEEIIDRDTQGMPADYSPNENRKPYFSKNGQRLFLGTAPAPVTEEKDTLLPEERYSLDLWHWQEPVLHTQQLSSLRRDRNRNYLAVYHIRQQKFVQLADEDMPDLMLDRDNDLTHGLGSSSLPYEIESSWAGSASRDLYLVNLLDGSRKLIMEGLRSRPMLSPAGKYVTWFDGGVRQWMVYDIDKGTTSSLTASIPFAFHDEDHDMPAEAGPYGFSGWTENDDFILINDRFDIWKIDPAGRKNPENLTQGYGRENEIRFRIQNLNPDEYFFRLDDRLIFEGFDVVDKQDGFFALENGQLTTLKFEDAAFSQLQKAKNAERYIWRRSTFNEYSNLWTGDANLSSEVRISDANPQQDGYYWGSVQLVDWLDFDHQKLQGLLYLPEDFDPNKKYPLLVYFYEKSSDGLHSHIIPAPSRSTINRPYCTSNGYVIFIPDITYKDGFPGESAYNAIMSGTLAMLERYPFIDRENMGLQGQSWGGYQIAYLVTRTNLFKAAMAGAPVSNMISAYGGIRWESGRSRQFQYEQTQSRIGGTPWEKPFRYIENSPVFFADKIETPLLIMANDTDGAVPWYQGIEFFMALRRLSKPAWLLVYNDEAHNLTKWPNRMDLSVRMYQFFDHFLKGAPAPIWLQEGIPAIEKGKNHGYDLVD
ncbi:MAG: prolyl oligopeptidase family serine peptidase [Bacteroides sp.]|jgi:dipeptidyl aminopeptidase/acylaminoacyl peptidase|nr:prolyl oligopeptidase family serine peptidase [Bacteroides sp.]